ncbi:MAG: beta strand repeat-containing protein, partial [Gemmatimonadales bacterium]
LVTFSSGQTSRTASFDGRAAGRVTVVATDTSGTYAPDTLVVNVLSTLEFRTIANPTFQATNFSINSAEQRAILVFLSDPAPQPAGLAVNFTATTPGIATISPATATIPGGQLSVQVDLTGTGVGSTSLTPIAAGFVGKPSSVTTFLAKFSVNPGLPSFSRVGVGQFVNLSVNAPNGMDRNTLVTLTRTNLTPIGLTQDTITIPASTFAFSVGFQYRALLPGADTVIASRSGWVPDSGAVLVTTPKVRLFGVGTLTAGAAASSWTAFTADSVGTEHGRIDTLAVTVTSRDPAVLQVTLPTGVIPANQSRVSRAGLSPLSGGSTYLVVTAAGHLSDSVLVTVQGAKLTLPFPVRVGVRQQLPSNTVSLPFSVPQPAPVVVHLAHTNLAISSSVDSVIIPANNFSGSFSIDGLAAGTDTIIGTAAGYAPDTMLVTVTPPLLRTSGLNTFPFNTSPPDAFQLFTADNSSFQHPSLDTVTIAVSSGDPNVFVLDSAVVHVLPGQVFSSILNLTPIGVGSARVFFSAAAPYGPDSSLVVTVRPSPLTFCTFCGTTVGTGQYLSYFISIPNPAPDTVRVALTHPGTIRATVPDTVLILPFNSSASFQWAGTVQGRDSIIATATGFVPDSAFITVTRPRLLVSNIIGTASVGDVTSTFVQTADSLNTFAHPVVDTVFVTVTSTDTMVLKADSAVVRVLPNNSGVSTSNLRVVGPGTARIIVGAPGYIPDTTNVLVATAPAISISPNSVTLGTGQQQRFFNAFIPNPVTDTTRVALALSDPTVAGIEDLTGTPIDTVLILPGSTFSTSFTVFAKNTVASIALTATAPGFSQGNGVIIVGTPQFQVNTSTTGFVGQDSVNFSLSTLDQTGGGQEVHDTLTVTLVSTNPAVLAVVSGTVKVPKSSSSATSYWRTVAPGTARIIATAPGYTADTSALITVSTPQLTLSLQPTVGVGQRYTGSVSIPFGIPSGQSLVVTLNNNNAAALSLPATVTIPQFNSSVSFTAVGTALGTAIGTASAPGFVTSAPDTTVVGTPILVVNGPNSVPLANATTSLSASTFDQANSNKQTDQNLTVTFTVDNPAIADFGGAPNTTLVETAGSFNTSSLTLNLRATGIVTITASAPGYTNGVRVITVQ